VAIFSPIPQSTSTESDQLNTAKMCFGDSKKQDDPGAKKNLEIDRQLKEDRKKQGKEVKILLLGWYICVDMLGQMLIVAWNRRR